MSTTKMILLKNSLHGKKGTEIDVYSQKSVDALKRKGIAALPAEIAKEESESDETKMTETVAESPAVSIPQKSKNQTKK